MTDPTEDDDTGEENLAGVEQAGEPPQPDTQDDEEGTDADG